MKIKIQIMVNIISLNIKIMKYKDFKPIIHNKKYPQWFFLFCAVVGDTYTEDTAETVKNRMENWINRQRNNIKIYNIEIFDFVDSDLVLEKAHFRIWYSK